MYGEDPMNPREDPNASLSWESLAQPTAPKTLTLADFERDYWAPDRESVLASMRGTPTPAAQTGPAPGSIADPNAFGAGWTSSGGRTVADLQRYVAQNPQYAASLTGSKGDKVSIGGRLYDAVIAAGAGGQGASWNDITNGEPAAPSAPAPSYTGSGAGVGYDNAATQLFLNQALTRLQELSQPVANPAQDAYMQQALARVAELQKAPYTAAEEQALITRMREPLTQARDAAMQRQREWIGARGIGDTSGLYGDAMRDVEKTYQQGIAQGSNQLSVQAIQEKQARANQALQILSDLMGVTSQQQQQDDARSQQALSVAALFPELDERRLNSLLAASGEGATSPQSLASIVSSIGNLNLNQQQVNNQSRQGTAAAWGQILGYLLNSSGRAA